VAQISANAAADKRYSLGRTQFPVKPRYLACVLLPALLSGCAIPQIDELRSMPPNAQFVVPVPLICLYNSGVEHVSSYIGMTEPRFTWYLDATQRYAWFRQPTHVD
jgi:hypothetical protein